MGLDPAQHETQPSMRPRPVKRLTCSANGRLWRLGAAGRGDSIGTACMCVCVSEMCVAGLTASPLLPSAAIAAARTPD